MANSQPHHSSYVIRYFFNNNILLLFLFNASCGHSSHLAVFEWIWSEKQMYVNNLPTVIGRLRLNERVGFELRSSGSNADYIPLEPPD